MSQTSADPLADWQPGSSVPLTDFAASLGMKRGPVKYALEQGLIEPDEHRGIYNRVTISWDQAVLLCFAVAFATAAGIAIVTALKALKTSGAQVGPTGIVIPVKGL